MTRRKSKAAEPDSAVPLQVALSDDIDEDALSKLLPEINLASLSSDDVVSIYRLLLSQLTSLDSAERERDEARADTERKDIELDQALQDKESLSNDLEASVESVHKELHQLKQERDQLVEDKTILQNQITTISASQHSSTTESTSLKERVEDTEREKRELVGVISRLKDESSQREEEIQTLRTNLKEARQEHQTLEARVRELRSIETSTKFKVDSLTQQLQLSQAEAERTNHDLTEKTEEFAKYRRTKHTEYVTLQSSLDSLTQTNAATETSFKTLQSAHTAQAHQLTQALSKVQALTGQLAEQEARYSNEANGLQRLVSMMEEREKQAKEIVENIEHEWATVGEKAERREAMLKAETEREIKGREQAEKRVEQLENLLERMGRGELPVPGHSVSSMPMRASGNHDLLTDGMMGLSPTVAMASKAQRSGKTFTEVYADYVRLQEEYAKKSAEYDHMDRTLSSVLAQIEERAPILSQQRLEYERLQSGASRLGSQLAQALAEGEASSNFAQEQTQKLAKLNNENSLLQKQLDDLGRQVQTLLREIARRDDPTIPPDEELENVEAALDTESLITNHLVSFKSIDGLQAQNQRLLKVVRELGQTMENEEKEYREAMEKEQTEAIKEAHDAMQELAAQLERQKSSSDSIIQAYVKERDTLRTMLVRSEKFSATSTLPQAATPNGVVVTTEQTDLARELEEVTGQFGVYRKEMGIDSGRLRDELVASQREVNQMGAVLAKANAKIEFLTDRQRMNEEQFQIHNQELNELTKRNRQLLDQWTRTDIECNRVSEELHLTTGRLEQLRNENANLRAEKKIWESVQGRLVEENRILTMERSHLSDLMSNVQKMHNDLERSGENDRRRLESQLQLLESQTQDLRGQVVQERESVRNISLQKDIELKELQHRLDKNALEFSKTREALVEAQTSRKHLEERVDDLTRQAKGNEEKLAVYERRSGSSGVPHAVDPDMTREQQLEAEVAELRSALKVAEVDLAAARSHKEQFQEISQASEAALAALNTTFDEYKASSETQIARHESECKSLQGRLEETNAELLQIRAQHNETLKSFETERTAWINDKKTLEDTIVDMSTSEKHSESDRTSWEEGMRALEERAKAAEGRYSNEVVAHAEAIKTVEVLRIDLATSQAASRESLTASETAQAKLLSSEMSWKQQKEALDKEVVDLNARCQDLSSQNTTLHQHLESVSTQATRIRQAADASVSQPAEGEEAAEDADSRLSELRSVVSYLRKEKGIVDLQLEMSKQENERLKAHIERLTQTLQETRDTLSNERERAIDNTASAAQHAELVERINQLNILRESNVTLRTECESASKKARDLEAKLKELSQELEPAKEQARSALAELNVTKIQMERLDGESRRWQERNAQLLSKYDRIDPAKVQALNDEIAGLKAEAASAEAKQKEAESSAEAQAARLLAVEDNFRNHKDANLKNTQQFRSKMGELNKQKSVLADEKRQLEAKVSSLEQEITTLQASVASKPSALPLSPAPASVSSEETQKLNALITNLRAERDKLLAEKESWNKPSGSAPTAVESGPAPSEWEAEKAQLLKARDEALEKAQKIANETKNIKFQNEKFQARISDMMKTKAADAEKQAAVVTEAVEKAKADMSNSADPATQETLQKRHAEELRSLEEKLTTKHEADLKARVESAVAEALKARPANGADADQKPAIEAAIAEYEKQAQARRAEEMASIEARHAEEIASAVDRGRMEQVAKGKLKDSQLVKAQKRVKELEASIHEWEAQGIQLPPIKSTVAATAPPPSAISPVQTAAKAPPLTASTSSAGPSQPKPTPTAPAANTTPLPRRPAPTGPAVPPRGGAVRGVGRGAPVGVGRGGLRTAPVKAIPSPISVAPTAGVSIMGAASKRPREEGVPAEDQSLVKRLKPAEPINKPAPIRRPNVPPE